MFEAIGIGTKALAKGRRRFWSFSTNDNDANQCRHVALGRPKCRPFRFEWLSDGCAAVNLAVFGRNGC
jgi:hypothetical protein